MKDVKRFVFLAMILMLTQFGAGPQLFSGETPVVKAPDITSGAAADLKANDESDKIVEDIKLFARALSVIDEAYVENVQMREMLYAAVKGMMESLGDRYSEFIDPERYKLLQIHLKGEYAGIGVILEMFGDIPGIKAVNPDSAAARAGLEALDKILKIDGSATSGVPIADIAAKLRGEADTPVMMTIQRDRIQ
ncbi:MAG: PDZ domain-containing protein, partial [Candidatus Omnitrophica bacterium]|nr:PDZ domain-containing protein [Candidatus Omnitrophota bacterium]